MMLSDSDGAISPSEAMLAMFGSDDERSESPSLQVEMLPEEESIMPKLRTSPVAESSQAPVQMYRSEAKRASRTARPADTSPAAMSECAQILVDVEFLLKKHRVRAAPVEKSTFWKQSTSGCGKGPGVRIEEGQDDQKKQKMMNHMLSIKARDLEGHNSEPYYLLGGNTAPMMYDRLAAVAMKNNAVQSSVTERSKNQAAASQTTRFSTRAAGQAAAPQMIACEMVMAAFRRALLQQGQEVVNPLASNAVNPCYLCVLDAGALERAAKDVFVCTSTARLLYNAMPTKLGCGSIISVARDLAKAELEHYAISNTMGYSNYMLTSICQAIVGKPCEYDHDAVWSSLFLIVYLMSDARSRIKLLRPTALTDFDYQIAVTIESYGRSELTRRARLRRQQLLAAEAKARKMMLKEAKAKLQALALAEHVGNVSPEEANTQQKALEIEIKTLKTRQTR